MRVECLGFVLPNDIRAPCCPSNDKTKKERGVLFFKRIKYCIEIDFVTSKARLVRFCCPKPLGMASVYRVINLVKRTSPYFHFCALDNDTSDVAA